MTTEAKIKAAIGAVGEIVGGCHFVANTASQVNTPYVVFHIISAAPDYGISQEFGTDFTCQVDVFAKSPEAAKGLALGVVKTAMEAAGFDYVTLTMHLTGQYSLADKTYQYITEYAVRE